MTHKRKTADQLYEGRQLKLADLVAETRNVLVECSKAVDEMRQKHDVAPKYVEELGHELWELDHMTSANANTLKAISRLETGGDVHEWDFEPVIFSNNYLGALHSTLQQFRNHVTGFRAKVLKAVKK